jgi:hypothetical protein
LGSWPRSTPTPARSASTSRQWFRLTSIRFVLIVLLAWPAGAQTLRLHDAERAKIARDAADAFRASQSDLFAAMLANLDAADQRDFALLARRNQARLEATLTALPDWTWRRFAEEVPRAAPQYDAVEETKSDGTALEAAREKLAEFRRAVAAARDINDPRLPMLQLAEELAGVEVDREVETGRAAEWMNAHAAALRTRRTAVEAEVRALAAFASTQPQDQTVAATVHAAATEGNEPRLRVLLSQLARYAAIVGSESLFAAESNVSAESERQRASIRLSEIHSRENAVLLRHGLDGLARYYEGGLKPAEIANLLRAAQAIALAVIAARVD